MLTGVVLHLNKVDSASRGKLSRTKKCNKIDLPVALREKHFNSSCSL